MDVAVPALPLHCTFEAPIGSAWPGTGMRWR